MVGLVTINAWDNATFGQAIYAVLLVTVNTYGPNILSFQHNLPIISCIEK